MTWKCVKVVVFNHSFRFPAHIRLSSTESGQIAYQRWDSPGLEKRESLPGAPGLAGFETRAKHQYGKRSVAETSVSAHPTRSPGPVPSPGRRTGESCSTAIAPALPPDHAIPSSSGPRVSVVQMKIPTQGQKKALNGARREGGTVSVSTWSTSAGCPTHSRVSNEWVPRVTASGIPITDGKIATAAVR